MDVGLDGAIFLTGTLHLGQRIEHYTIKPMKMARFYGRLSAVLVALIQDGYTMKLGAFKRPATEVIA